MTAASSRRSLTAVVALKNIFLAIETAWTRSRAWLAGHFSLIAIFAPIALVVAGAGAYGFWWRTVADGVHERVAHFQVMQRALGRDIRWESFAVGGFPYRVEARLNSLHFTAPDRGSAWDGDRVVMHVPTLALDRLTISFEGQQRYFYGSGTWIETNARADKALLTLAASDGRERAKLDIERLEGKAKYDATDFNFIVASAVGGLSLRAPSARGANPQVDASARLENVALQGQFDLPLGSAIQLVALDARAALPVNLAEPSMAALLSAWRRQGTPIEIKSFELDWGGVTVAAKGSFKLDQNALPEGSFRLTLGNHPRILELLEGHGWIDAETRATAKKVLDVLAFMSGDKQRRVTVPLRIQKGDVFVGPAKVASLLPAATASAAPQAALPQP